MSSPRHLAPKILHETGLKLYPARIMSKKSSTKNHENVEKWNGVKTNAKLTICSAVMGSTSFPVNLLALNTASLSQSVQYTWSSNVVIENGCRNVSAEYNITFRPLPSKLHDEIVFSLASTYRTTSSKTCQ